MTGLSYPHATRSIDARFKAHWRMLEIRDVSGDLKSNNKLHNVRGDMANHNIR
ncbi:MAG: hypothetical protein FWD73_09925 [Polyangiaceae bacterium]|nr:hypothetical protein [Polyangiaceae bacterium]